MPQYLHMGVQMVQIQKSQEKGTHISRDPVTSLLPQMYKSLSIERGQLSLEWMVFMEGWCVFLGLHKAEMSTLFINGNSVCFW